MELTPRNRELIEQWKRPHAPWKTGQILEKKMNATQLRHPDGTNVPAWQCDHCLHIYAEKEAYSSQKCCKCSDCGKIDRGVMGKCIDCQWKDSNQRDREALEKAEIIPGYSGAVCSGDQFWSSMEDYLDQHDGEDSGIPQYLHTCNIHHPSIDTDAIIQDLHENMGLEDELEIEGEKELRDAIDAFNKANEAVVYWDEDSAHKTPTNEAEWIATRDAAMDQKGRE